jgi:hypothetical protein
MPNHVIRDRIWESKKLEQCSDAAAAWYPWIYLVCNDDGIFEYHPRAVWMAVFRRRPTVTMDDVTCWLGEYDRVGLLIRYHIDGELAFWTGFKGRKRSERKSSTYPDFLTFHDVVRRLQELDIKEVDGRAVPATRPRRDRDATATRPRRDRESSYRIVSDQIRSETPATGARPSRPPNPLVNRESMFLEGYAAITAIAQICHDDPTEILARNSVPKDRPHSLRPAVRLEDLQDDRLARTVRDLKAELAERKLPANPDVKHGLPTKMPWEKAAERAALQEAKTPSDRGSN